MKKITFSLMIMILSLIAVPNMSLAHSKDPIAGKVTTEVPDEIQAKYDRLEEIKNMDKSELTRSEKKELRKEVRAIKSELRTTSNGVYLSIGAIIIIIL